MEASSIQPSLLITINCNNRDCYRAHSVYNMWGTRLQDQLPSTEIRFVTVQPFQEHLNMSILVDEHETEWRQIFYNNIAGYEHFLNEFKYKWMLRTTEDVVIRVLDFPIFLEELENGYPDPYVRVVKGEVRPVAGTFYLHGGPGWILSRGTVERIYQIRAVFTQMYEEAIDKGDDAVTDWMLQKVGVDSQKAHIPEFFGPPIRDKVQQQFLVDGDPGVLPQCPEFYTCPEVVRPIFLDRCLIFHGGTANFFVQDAGDRLQKSYGRNVILYTMAADGYLCRIDSDGLYQLFKLFPDLLRSWSHKYQI